MLITFFSYLGQLRSTLTQKWPSLLHTVKLVSTGQREEILFPREMKSLLVLVVEISMPLCTAMVVDSVLSILTLPLQQERYVWLQCTISINPSTTAGEVCMVTN